MPKKTQVNPSLLTVDPWTVDPWTVDLSLMTIDSSLYTLDAVHTGQPSGVFSKQPFTELKDFNAEPGLCQHHDAAEWGKISRF